MSRYTGNGDLILSGICVSVSSDAALPTYILDHIDLSISPGEWIHVVGINGSGKTTLARLLAGLTIEGVSGLWNRGFAGTGAAPYVMQHPDSQLFGETPREEIIFALEWQGLPPSDIVAQTDAILMLTGLLPVADFQWDQLSGGQRQLAAVAAATACPAPLIVFDEATSMLDDKSRHTVLQNARRLHREGTAVVWVTQRLDELESASRVAALADGRIVFDGTGQRFLFGASDATPDQPSPCEQCGLRLPYLASLAVELNRMGKLNRPFPVTLAEWRKVLVKL